MTDRPIFYSGEIPLSTDVLFAIRAAMIGIGNLAQMTFGTNTVFSGLAVTQTSSPSMSVNVGPGQILTNTVVDSNTYGSLTSDSDALVKLGINTETTVLGPFTAPVTSGQSVDILVEASFSEADGTSVTLPYYNAANPASPFSGPANSGTPQNTRRLQTVSLNVVVGTPATTGSQTVPSLTGGYVGVAVITIAHGATTIINSNISAYVGAPAVNAQLGATNQGFTVMEELTGSGTFVVPNGVTRLKYSVLGAGGGSAGGANGAGGGGGGFSSGYTAVTPGAGISYAQGGAGAAGTAGNSGGNGGGSTFGSITANGGSGGASGGAGGAGGTASGGTINQTGQPGGVGNSAAVDGAAGGAAGNGNPGAMPGQTVGVGTAAPFPGGGGGGTPTGGFGGAAGGAGQITIEY